MAVKNINLLKVDTMLQKEKGNCQKCNVEFGEQDTMQSVNVKCEKCGKWHKLCKTCKAEGCDCGGYLMDAWEQNPGLMY